MKSILKTLMVTVMTLGLITTSVASPKEFTSPATSSNDSDLSIVKYEEISSENLKTLKEDRKDQLSQSRKNVVSFMKKSGEFVQLRYDFALVQGGFHRIDFKK